MSYRLYCVERSVTTNWVSDAFAVLNGPATFMTLADAGRHPHDVRVDLPPIAGTDLSGWFTRTVSSTDELDYDEALEWYGRRFAPGSRNLELLDEELWRKGIARARGYRGSFSSFTALRQ